MAPMSLFSMQMIRQLYSVKLWIKIKPMRRPPWLAIYRNCSSIHKVLKPKKPKGQTDKVKHFVDYKSVVVQAGAGGDGCMSFLRESCNEWAGPDGGDGGNGGHVIFRASTNCRSLSHFKSLISAEHGIKGGPKCCHGRNAEHTDLEVPIGTIVKTDSGTIIGDLEKQDQICIVARGGAGGKGNHFFLSNEERAPAKAEKGAQGQLLRLKIELRTMAHAGLIGFPNAGKSTLLRAISRARPKVAAYPFTTLNPHVGIVEYDDYEQVSVADIPGLIKGAHMNYGLGISFLRHIQRCACLLYVLDLAAEEPWVQLEDLKFELEQYETGLSERPHAIIGNKADLPGAEEKVMELRKNVQLPVIAISAKYRRGMEPLLDHLRMMYNQHVKKSIQH